MDNYYYLIHPILWQKRLLGTWKRQLNLNI